MQNKHIEHIDDMVFHGHALHAIDCIAEMVDALTGAKKPKHLHVSTKFDGSPAVVFGVNPNNGRFFVGTKSVFNKLKPIIIHDQRDIANHYSDKPELGAKLMKVWDNLENAFHAGMIPSGVYQGDLMYTSDSVEEDDDMIHFTPNTITYGAFKNIPMYESIRTAALGIVVHTSYEGAILNQMSADCDVDQSLFKDGDVHFIDPSVNLDHLILTDLQYSNISDRLITCNSLAHIISGSSVIEKHRDTLKMFLNHCIRIGENNPSPKMYEVFCINRDMNELAEDWNHAHVSTALAIRYYIDSCKRELMHSLNMSTDFYHEINGTPTQGEGYVVKYHGVVTKFVDRIEFSRRNFANMKFSKVNNK